MANRDFVEEGYALVEECKVFEAEVVTGIHTEATLAGSLSSLGKWSYRSFGVGGVTVGIGLGIQLDAVGTCCGSRFDLVNVGIYKYRSAHPGLFESLYQRAKEFGVSFHIPAGARCESIGSIGHESHLGGAHLQNKVDEVIGGISFDIKLAFQQGPELVYIATTYMALIGPWVYGDTVGSETFDIESYSLDIGPILTPGITQGRDFIYINA